jgi:serine/threonine protein kinase
VACRLYTAHSDWLGCPVTVSVYPPLTDQDGRRRFDDAAAAARRLAAHPGVLTIHDWGHGADGRPWVVSDLQPPETVDNLLKAHGPLPVEQALRIGVLVAGALETAHRAGIVHGDLSPARLVIGPQGEPLVADIGLAEFSDFPGFGALNNPIRYFAPPEVLERTGVTPASDVYSLATTVYALLAGSAPHEKPADVTDSNASLLLRILQIEVPPIVRPDEDIDGVEAALLPALVHAAERRPLRVLDLAWSLQDVQRNIGLDVVDPVVLDQGSSAELPVAPPPAAEAPGAPAAPVPPNADALPAWYTDPPNPASTPGTNLVHLFSETPPDFIHPSPASTARHWSSGLGHLAGTSVPAGNDEVDEGPRGQPGEARDRGEPRRAGPPAVGNGAWPSNGHRPNGHTAEPPAGAPPGAIRPEHERPSRPAGISRQSNGFRPAPTAGSDDELGPTPQLPGDVARQHEPLGRPPLPPRSRAPDPVRPVAGVRTPVDADPTTTRQGSAADPAASGSALERARQTRMRQSARSGTDDRRPGDRAEEPARFAPPAPTPNGAPALPVIVLIVVVVLLTLGVAYMVITGDGTANVVEEPGASAPSAQQSVGADSAGSAAVCPVPGACSVRHPRQRPSVDQP